MHLVVYVLINNLFYLCFPALFHLEITQFGPVQSELGTDVLFSPLLCVAGFLEIRFYRKLFKDEKIYEKKLQGI